MMVKLPAKNVVLKWSKEELLEWFRKEDLHDCLEAFRNRDINGAKMLNLSDDLVITFSELKITRRRQIVKCINECKTQACNAKKLVGTIKAKNKGVDENSDFDDDDDVGWGSDFDDDDDSEGAVDDVTKEERFISNNKHKYELKPSEDSIYEPVSDYCSNGIEAIGFKLLKDDNVLNYKTNDTNNSEMRENGDKTRIVNKNGFLNGLNNDVSKHSEIEKSDSKQKLQTCSSNDAKGSSPKPSPRLMAKPAITTKPEVPKNKPQIIPRKPLITNGVKAVQNSVVKRPPSEPPPPPLPKSPPPDSPKIPTELKSIFDECLTHISANLNNSQSLECANSPSTTNLEDEYLSPIRTETPIIMDRKLSTSTISSLSYSTRDGDSLSGGYCSNSPTLASSQCLSHSSIEDDYEPFIESGNLNSPHMSNVSEDTYEVVNDSEALNVNIVPIGQRPLLPKAKETTNAANKAKLVPDVFPSLTNWTKIGKERKSKDKQEYELTNEENCMLSNLDIMNNNSNCTNNLGISARPLPPLPQLQSSANNEPLRNFSWFHSVEREDAEALLMAQDEDGAYLVRESKRAGKSNPYTLTIFHAGRVFHLNIRKRPDALYALGKEKPREKTFKAVQDLIRFHHTEPILLTTRGRPAGRTRLIITPTPCTP